MRTIAVALGMQVVAAAFVLVPCRTARAQMDLDAGLAGLANLGGFVNPAVLQAALLYQLYGIQQQQFDALPEAQRTAMQAEMAKRAAEYFTNGAEATGVPTSGPAAAYFTHGAEVTAANTANAVPFGESAFPPPREGQVGGDASVPAPPPEPAVDAATAASAATPPARRPRAVGDAAVSPSPAASTETTAAATPPALSGTAAVPSPDAATRAPLRQPNEDQGILGSTSWLAPVYAHMDFGWVWPTMGGLSLGAVALFFALRSR